MISHPLSPQDNNTQLLARYLNSKDHVQAKLVLQSILGGQRIPTDALRLLCQFADQTRQYDFAVESLCGILALEPSRHAAYYFLGYAMCRLGQFEAGVECFDHALSIEPRESTYALDRASALGELGRHNEALAAYEAILSLDPLHPEAHSYKGNALLALGEVDAAIASFDRAISLEPQAGAAYLNRGNAFLQKAAYALALASYDGAIAVDPSNARAFANRAAALKSLHRLEESLTSSEQAIALEPSFMDARFGMAITQLLAGDLRGGFRNYHVRWQTEVFRPICRQFQQPLWLGESPITGKRLLVHNEQGLGDSIQFCRFVSQAAQAGAHVIYEVEPALFGLMQSLPGVHTLVRQRDPLPAFDYYCPVMSLPVALETTLENIPGQLPYLRAAPDKLAHWAQRLGNKTKPRIGLAWSGSPTHKADHQRSIALNQLLSALPAGLSYFSLQKELRATDAAVLDTNLRIQHFGQEIRDFSDTAALCQAMDLVIAVDTSIAHLGGALGIPTWVLLPHTPDWRWFLAREDSPWYPSARLIRQSQVNGWSEVLQTVHHGLQQYFEALG